MRKIFVALFGALIFCSTIDRAHAGQSAPSPAVVEEIYQRYSPRVKGLTRAKVENVWLARAKDEPWYQETYGNVYKSKDSPEQVKEFRREFPCEVISGARRDPTYAMTATQYRCTASFTVQGIDASIVNETDCLSFAPR